MKCQVCGKEVKKEKYGNVVMFKVLLYDIEEGNLIHKCPLCSSLVGNVTPFSGLCDLIKGDYCQECFFDVQKIMESGLNKLRSDK